VRLVGFIIETCTEVQWRSFQASAALCRSALFWGFTQRGLIVSYVRFGKPIDPIFNSADLTAFCLFG